jgi:type I restriction enzyme, S subunit
MTAGLRTYPEYTDSGLPWLGQVPMHWEVRRNGRLFSQRNEIAHGSLPILEVSLKTGVRVRDMDELKRKQVMSDREKYKRAVKGDIAYNMMRMWQGAVGVAPVDGLVSPAYVVARPHPEVEPRYFSYLFRTNAYMNEVDGYSRGIVKDRNRLYWEDFKGISSCTPPLAEQRSIADYLDANAVKVRRFIRNRRQLIGVLNEQKQAIINRAVTRGLDPHVPLKASGIDWLGDVPEHWMVKPLKRWVSINELVLPESTDPDYTFQYLEIGCVDAGLLVEKPVQLRFGDAPSRARRVLRIGDTIISTVRTYLRAVYFVTDNADDLVASTGFAALTPGSGIMPEFLGIALRSTPFIDRVTAHSIGIAYPAISETRLGDFAMAIPPSIDEQAAIVAYVRCETEVLDKGILRAQREIDLIREYRTRLIADVVTGKVDVRRLTPAPEAMAAEAAPEDLDDEMPGEDEAGFAPETDEADDEAVGADHDL